MRVYIAFSQQQLMTVGYKFRVRMSVKALLAFIREINVIRVRVLGV